MAEVVEEPGGEQPQTVHGPVSVCGSRELLLHAGSGRVTVANGKSERSLESLALATSRGLLDCSRLAPAMISFGSSDAALHPGKRTLARWGAAGRSCMPAR